MAYNNLSGYQSAYQRLAEQQSSLGSNARADLDMRLNQVGSQFSTMFKNLVGRDANETELNQFFTESGGNIIYNSPLGRSEADTLNVRNQIGTYVGDTFQGAANDNAEQQLKGQQAEANSLADLFRTQGRQAISDTESGLLDYQQRLFERLRPNLITSLQAQGLLNTGALSQSIAGAQGDLATAAQGQLLDMRYQNEQGANAIAYGGASAPYMFKQQQIMNQPSMFQQSGADALNRAFQTYTQNLDFQQRSAMMNQQASLQRGMQPSFLQTLGQSAATSLGQNLNGPAWMQAASKSKSAVVGG